MSNWMNALLQAPNPGEAFANAYQNGLLRRDQQETRKLEMQNQQEDRAFRREEMGMKRQQQQQEQTGDALTRLAPMYQQAAKLPYEQRRAYIQQVKPTLVQMGVPADLIDTYDPTDERLSADISVLAKPKEEAADPSSVREYEYAKSQGYQKDYTTFLDEYKGSPLVVDNGDGTKTIYQRGALRGGQPQTAQPQAALPQPGAVEDGYRFKGGNPSDPNSWEAIGGQPGQPSAATFPASGY